MSQVWCSRLQCESISCVNLSSNLLWKFQLPAEKAGLEIRRMSLCREHVQICISPLPLTKSSVKQQALSWTQASRIFFPNPSFLSHQPESCLLLPDVPTGHRCCLQNGEGLGRSLGLVQPLALAGEGMEEISSCCQGKKRGRNHVSPLES